MICIRRTLSKLNRGNVIMNRYEDERLAEGRFAAFTDKKERKLLASDHRRKKMDTCLQKVRSRRARGGTDGAHFGVSGCSGLGISSPVGGSERERKDCL